MSCADPRFAKFVEAPSPKGDPEEVRAAPLYDSLSERIRLVERQGPGAVQWDDLARDALELLVEQSHDLSVACWAAVALARSEGSGGLALGLAIIRHLLDAEWDMLYPPPKRERQRRGSIVWLTTQLARVLPDSPFDDEQGKNLLIASKESAAIDRIIGEKMGDAPSMRELLSPLAALARQVAEQQAALSETHDEEQTASIVQVEQPAPVAVVDPLATEASVEETATVQPVVEAGGGPGRLPSPPPSRALPDALPFEAFDITQDNAVSRVQSTIRPLALAMLEKNAADWKAYVLLGATTWLAVDELPEADASGRTMLLPLSQIRRDDLAAMEAAGQTLELVTALAQSLSASGMFWLDGHFLLVRSLQKLAGSNPSGQWSRCMDIVTGNVRLFVNRLPGVEHFLFQDGTPFASEATRLWLKPVVASVSVAAQDSDTVDDAAHRAWAMLAEGNEDTALDILGDCVRSADGERQRFKARLQLARLCLDVGHHIVAMTMLDMLQNEAESRDLASWDPWIWSELNRQRYRCAVLALPLAETASEKSAMQALTALVRTDPVDAIRLARNRGV